MTTRTTATEPGTQANTDPWRDRPSHRILLAISDATGVDVTEVEPLYETIDLDTVDALFSDQSSPPDRPIRLTFVAADCRVTVCQDGTVSAEPLKSSDTTDVSTGG